MGSAGAALGCPATPAIIMPSALLDPLDSLAEWRQALDLSVERLVAWARRHELLDPPSEAMASTLRQRLASDKLVLAFVAEFSRGKSELINALFFADTGHRVLPATPGRTTMCPVELAWDARQAPSLSLLPIATRRDGQPVMALREQTALWHSVPLPVGDGAALAQALRPVMQTQRVPLDEARALGFWSDEHPEDNPPCDAQDQVEIPAWRHALINYPHPLLKRGLVVLDTPGLNAIGAEPELTLALLPSAHAALFLLAADTGVSRSDLSVWRDHLGDRGIERFVVLNKIDTLADPLLDSAQVAEQVRQQCDQAARTLGVPASRVYALSARQALAARLQGDVEGLTSSGLPGLEEALVHQLLPQRSLVLGRLVDDGALALEQMARSRLLDQQRQVADQLAELQGLRGKSAGRLNLVAQRLTAETADFERCAPRLAALRLVLNRQIEAVLQALAADGVRQAVHQWREAAQAGVLMRGATRAFGELGRQLDQQLTHAAVGLEELEAMLRANLQPLNVDFGFALNLPSRPQLVEYERELDRVLAAHVQYVGVAQAWRLAQPGFLDRFCRLLHARLRVVFEAAAHDVDLWGRAVGTQIEQQLRERRRMLAQRGQAHARIRVAEGGLEQGIATLEAQQAELQLRLRHLAVQVETLRLRAATPPAAEGASSASPLRKTPRLQLVNPARGAA